MPYKVGGFEPTLACELLRACVCKYFLAPPSQGYIGPRDTLQLGERCLGVCIAKRRYALCEQLTNFLQRAHEAVEQEQAEAAQSA